MGNAAGQLADRFHFTTLPKSVLRAFQFYLLLMLRVTSQPVA